MKKASILAISLTTLMIIASGCASINYTGTWKDSAKLGAKSYETIFVAALTENLQAKQVVENDLALALQAKGFKVIKSSDVFLPNFNNSNSADENAMLERIKSLGCNGILTAALIDQASEERYVPGSTVYAPYPRYGFYGGYGLYFRQRYPVVYEPGYYANDHTYFFENNFYDVDNGEILFSIQSKSVNPPNLDAFSKTYASSLIKQLVKDGILQE